MAERTAGSTNAVSMAEGKSDRLAKMMPILTVLAVILVAVAAYFLLFIPKIAALSGVGSAALADMEAQVASEEAYVEELDAALARYGLLNKVLKQKTQTIIPLEIDAPGIFVQLDGVARKHNFLVTAVATTVIGDEIGVQGQRLVKVSVNVEGGDYRQFTTFLADLERSVRLIDVQSVVFTPLSAKYSLGLKTYYLDPGSEAVLTDGVSVQ